MDHNNLTPMSSIVEIQEINLQEKSGRKKEGEKRQGKEHLPKALQIDFNFTQIILITWLRVQLR